MTYDLIFTATTYTLGEKNKFWGWNKIEGSEQVQAIF